MILKNKFYEFWVLNQEVTVIPLITYTFCCSEGGYFEITKNKRKEIRANSELLLHFFGISWLVGWVSENTLNLIH